MSGAIDLSKLPGPSFLQETEFETLMQEQLDTLALIDPAYAAAIKVGDPGYNILLAVAYVRMYDRQKINESGRSVMLAYATGADLDNLAALFGLERQIIDAGDPEAVPLVPPTYEDDDALRAKVVLAPEGFSTAGSIGAYKYHALTAGRQLTETVVESRSENEVIIRKLISPSGVTEAVKDASVVSPAPGEVEVGVLSYNGNGTPSPALLTAVENALSAESARPLADQVTVVAATITTYSISATLYFLSGVDRAIVLEQATSKLEAYVDDVHRLGRRMSVGGIQAACFQPGVVRVMVASPAADITPGVHGAAYCTGITLADGGVE